MPDMISNTATDISTPPIEVSTSPAPDQTMALVRQVLVAAGGALTTQGIISQNAENLYIGVALAVAPIIIGQLKVRLRATQLADLARDPAVPQVQPKSN